MAAISLSSDIKRMTSVDVAGSLIAVILNVSPTFMVILVPSSTDTELALCKTVNFFRAITFGLFLSFAMISTVPGAITLIFPVVSFIVATFVFVL